MSFAFKVTLAVVAILHVAAMVAMQAYSVVLAAGLA